MSSLSAGTRNLKFMQRAEASKAVVSGAGTASLPPSTSTQTTEEAAVEEEGKWTLRRPTPVTAAAGPSRPRIQFVDSYLPFVEPAPREVEVVGLGGGGGRMAFGGFGTKEEVAEEDEEEGMEGMDSEDEPSEVVTRKPKDKNSSKGKEKSTERSIPAQTRVPPQSRTFQRPQGFETPTATPQKTQAEKLRQTIAGMKSVSVTSDPSTAKKRAHEDVDTDVPKRPKVDSKPPKDKDGKSRKDKDKKKSVNGKKPVEESTSALKVGKPPKGMSLDEREKQLKAAKKAQKKKDKGK